MSYTTRISWELLRSVNSTSLAGSYIAIGGPLLYPSIILKMVNASGTLVTVSIDGVNDYDVCPANSFWLYDELKTGNPNTQYCPAGTQIYIKGTFVSGTSGSIYLVSQYNVSG